ncbi:CRISPR-associated helicase, Cas3 family [Schinkia azotoformans MEV2011]|uniref:CRISPR-associated helicase, Cas3 family n=1 Tax=Schinkia azotoformans MEV2011 TaxID=1348973 RepID=A0A072NEU5_SCHAZ|nr:CRISPR-associated helicase/endonuclease Cas3 [Schinkia azotoformans]KEF36214.1 CRISPR-associated helicase, Cas3 family [Schinkia azotoformans MEV2011]MEC1693889.1 CRISPR-associated helicase/endonuclease Cas3 [Schinkia azotoformans]MEC1718657.1 CRISPR-associated helicase/endonuclease Cas3 [Schinkia azotoformans]MEC1724766.1 CRISPR-associated helicase/endonuclease Cas3 [Schinkia azotoformans]MEC1743775.1 CRISPR-associated helicase/endonuclease Cas3 [Schinkia azotoformans]
MDEHIRGTYFQARRFSHTFDRYGITAIAAIAHDLGKKSAPFVQYLKADVKARGSVQHAIGGAIALFSMKEEVEDERIIMAAAIVAGHHTGMPDLRTVFTEKIPKAPQYLKAIPDLSQMEMQIIKDILKRFPGLPLGGKSDSKSSFAYKEMLMRMCFSTLIDADFLDTERYFDYGKSIKRQGKAFSIHQLDEQLQNYMLELRREGRDKEINKYRNEVYMACREAAKQPLFFRALVVPTGLGKTLASIAFALEHAKQFNKKRIIAALPFVNIIDQTAQKYQEVFGKASVLEQHSQLSYTDDKEELMGRSRLAAENWDSLPIIVTTTVELFESLFSNRTSKVRKLHRLANSVIILDEFQKLPIHVLAPIFQALHILMEHFNVTVVLCSATPLSFENAGLIGNMGAPIEIFENRNQLFECMKRVEYIRVEKPLTVSELVARMKEHPVALCILNTRKDAFRVYREAIRQKVNGQHIYHLSNRMCPHHRKKVIEQIKEDLKNEKSILVIATSLVEAGVDFDFPAVFRAMAPLDSIVQAAGRSNREGKLDKGAVFIFELIEGGMPGGIYRKGTEQTKILLDHHGTAALHEPWIFEEFFRSLYTLGGDDLLDSYGITSLKPFSFETAGRLFQMIDQNTVSILCKNYKSENGQIEKLIRMYKEALYLTKEWYREAQLFAVNEYVDGSFFKENQNQLEKVSEGWYIWHGDYDMKTGIMDMDEGGE